jgi:hypothetical protein
LQTQRGPRLRQALSQRAHEVAQARHGRLVWRLHCPHRSSAHGTHGAALEEATMTKRSRLTRVSAGALFAAVVAVALPVAPRDAAANEPVAPEGAETCYDYGLIKVCCDGGGCRIVRWPW